jgi:hypothetical protein
MDQSTIGEVRCEFDNISQFYHMDIIILTHLRWYIPCDAADPGPSYSLEGEEVISRKWGRSSHHAPHLKSSSEWIVQIS